MVVVGMVVEVVRVIVAVLDVIMTVHEMQA